MRKPAFCICKNKGADQLRSICTADQRLCFCCIESPKFQASSHLLWLAAVQCVSDLVRHLKPGFLMTWLIERSTLFVSQAGNVQVCEVGGEIKEKLKKFRFRKEKNIAALLCR